MAALLQTNIIVILVSGTDVLYCCVVDMENNLVRKSDGGFDRNEYREYPERYVSTFSTKVCQQAYTLFDTNNLDERLLLYYGCSFFYC